MVYFDYTVFPLEGVWDMSEKGKLQDTLIKMNSYIIL